MRQPKNHKTQKKNFFFYLKTPNLKTCRESFLSETAPKNAAGASAKGYVATTFSGTTVSASRPLIRNAPSLMKGATAAAAGKHTLVFKVVPRSSLHPCRWKKGLVQKKEERRRRRRGGGKDAIMAFGELAENRKSTGVLWPLRMGKQIDGVRPITAFG